MNRALVVALKLHMAAIFKYGRALFVEVLNKILHFAKRFGTMAHFQTSLE